MDAKALYELISARRSCRDYQAEQIPQDMLEQVLKAGQMAPSGMNVQQCHFIALRTAELLERVRVLIQQIFAAMETDGINPKMANAAALAREGKHNFFYGAPTLIIVANRRDNPNNVADSAAALQNMMLMATSLGLGNCWINNLRWHGDVEPVRQFLNEIGVKENEAVYGALALGYASAALGKALPRTGNAVDIIE
ncbi:MAG: nitroreductase [Clostridiales bacterium]|nr:nitroreductase [Clostridiales bacterium]